MKSLLLKGIKFNDLVLSRVICGLVFAFRKLDSRRDAKRFGALSSILILNIKNKKETKEMKKSRIAILLSAALLAGGNVYASENEFIRTRATSVLPTPVGPTKSSDAMGLPSSVSPALDISTASATLLTASSCP